MKYLEVSADGDGYRCVLADAPIPVPRAGEVLVQVAASGVNRADLSQIAGHYPPPPGESDILGLEVSGTLVETGARVCALVAGGGYAEFVAVPRGQLLPVPGGVEVARAAAIPEAFLTAFLNLSVEGGLERGGRALIHAGASGVGLAAIALARYLGASAAATSRNSAKLEALRRAGAELAIDSSEKSFVDEVEARWGRDAIDVVLDPIGAGTLGDDLRVLRPGGRIVLIATMSGAGVEIDLRKLMSKRARLIGSTLRSRSREEKARLVEQFRVEILPGFETGELRETVDSTYPAARANEAFRRMKANLNVGKILIDWTQPSP